MTQKHTARSHARFGLVLTGVSAFFAIGSTLIAQIPLYTYYGGNEFGNDLDHVGDVDGDGYCDFAIGVPRDSTAGVYAGKIELRSGKTGALLYQILGAGDGDQFGSRVVGAGDVDFDGYPDIAGSSLESQSSALAGYVGLFSGSDGTVIREIHGNIGDNGFGRALDAGVDVDGDGVCDVLVGAFASNDAYLYSANSGEMIASFHNASGASDGFGKSVAFVSDLDGDQAPDCLIGAPNGNYAHIRSSMGGQTLRTFQSTEPGAQFGAWVVNLGDTNLDGYEDIGIGAPLAGLNGPASGSAMIFTANDAALQTRVNGLGGFEWGSRIASAGDYDLDGRADFVVGSPYSDLAILYSGKTSQTLAAYPGDNTSYGYGGVLAGGGDCDNDGIPNVLIGSTGHPLSLPLQLQVKLFKECAGTFEWIAQGCAVSNGVVPRLDVSGCAKAKGWIAIRVSGTNKPTPAIVLVGLTPGQATLKGGCSVLIANLAPTVFAMTLEPQTLGSAEKTMFVPLPPNTPIGQVYMQSVLPESGYAATTNVVRMTIE